MPRIGGQVVGGAHHGTHEDGGADEISIASLSGTPAALSTHEADLDAHTKNLLELLRTGEYHSPCFAYGGAGADLIVHQLYAIPFLVARAMTIDRIAIQVTTEDAGKNMRVGLYNNGTNLYPGTLVVDGGEVSVNATGLVAATIDESLTKGLYWLAVVDESNAKLEKGDIIIPILGFLSTDLGSINHCWAAPHAYGALPDPYPTGGSFMTTTVRVPLIAARIASLD